MQDPHQDSAKTSAAGPPTIDGEAQETRQAVAEASSAPISKTIVGAIDRINEAHAFYRSEMVRAETVFSALLLPASLTFVSVLTLTHANQLLKAAHWALVAFFSCYLAILFIDLCAIQHHEGKVRTLQNNLYAQPASADAMLLSEFPVLQEAYRAIDRKMSSSILIRPLTKILLSVVAALIAAGLSFVM